MRLLYFYTALVTHTIIDRCFYTPLAHLTDVWWRSFKSSIDESRRIFGYSISVSADPIGPVPTNRSIPGWLCLEQKEETERLKILKDESIFIDQHFLFKTNKDAWLGKWFYGTLNYSIQQWSPWTLQGHPQCLLLQPWDSVPQWGLWGVCWALVH